MSDMIEREAAMKLRDTLADIIGAAPMSSIHSALSEYRKAIRALPAVEVGVKWEHIQTAPRGGEWFIARTARGTTRVVHYADEYDRYPISHDSAIWETAPIEWTPLNAALSALTVTPAPDAGKVQALYDPESHWGDFIKSAYPEAEKAMRKFPQPNYVISKVAEEAGEVVKAAIHCAEGRETAENVRAEMRQLIAVLYRLWVEGDQVHGLPPVSAALAAMKEG